MTVTYTIADSKDDLIDVLRLRVEIFVMEQNGPHDEEPDVHDKESAFVVAKADGTIIGTARFRNVGDTVKIERIAVKKEYRGRGIGRRLVDYAIEHIEREGPKVIFLHAQTAAEDFYQKLGFHPVGDRFVEAGIEHIKMVREV